MRNQVVDLLNQAYDNADNLGADKNRYAMSGGSAGAALAIAVAYKLVSTGQGDRISGLITMSGMFLSACHTTILRAM